MNNFFTASGSSAVNLGQFNPRPRQLIGGDGAGTYVSHQARFWQFRDTLSYQTGKHLIKTGMELRIHHPEDLSLRGDAWGTFDFTGNFTGYDVGDLLLGLPYTTAIAGTRDKQLGRMKELGFFLQDDWKITSKLTVTAGVRFQRYGVPWDASGLYYNFDVTNMRVVVPDALALSKVHPAYPTTIPVVTAAAAGYPNHLRRFKSMLVEPRLGIAWRPWTDKTVIRLGYGMYHIPYTWATMNATDLNQGGGPFLLTESFGPNVITNGVPSFTFAHPFPAPGGGTIPLQSVFSQGVDQRTKVWPLDQQWNLTLERELPGRMAFRGSYVGGKGSHWPYTMNLQTPTPSTTPFASRPLSERRPYGAGYAAITQTILGGNSTHHGLELELTRQFAAGMYIRGWYNWKKSLNDVQGGLFGSTYGGRLESPYDLAREKGYQDGFTPKTARVVAVYDLPFGRGKRFGSTAPGWLDHLIGAWTITPVYTFSGNGRFTPTYSGRDPANVGGSSGRADALCDGNKAGPTPGRLWSGSCYAAPPVNAGRYGTASRGSIYGPNIWGLGLNVFKTWYLTGKENGPYFKVEGYISNLLNHSNTGGPQSTNVASPEFGLWNATSGDVRSIYFRFRIGF